MFEDLIIEVRQEIDGIKSSLSQGVCETYAEYQRMVGMIHAYELTISKCADIERRLTLVDEEDF
jgi:hypothetical protein